MLFNKHNMMVGAAACALALVSGCAPEPGTRADHMQEHFAQVDAVRDAIISGDLEATREPAEWLAGHESMEGIPEGWGQHVTQMQRSAQTVVAADDIAVAAAATADMAGICGACHQGLDEGAQFTIVVVPSEESGVVAHMLRHEWAVDRMWEGLIGPSDEAWDAGANALGEAALEPQDTPEEVGVLAARVHELGGEAVETTGFSARASLYGQLLTTCAECHQLMEAGPGTRLELAGAH
jgi:cytochrome c553